MFQLLNPIALFASAAVVIPVLVHLWNIRKGKILKVGSIALLAESSKQRARSRRITNWPLFLIRCTLLVLLALLLADPSWQKDKKNVSKGWVLVSREHLDHAYQQYGGTIDSLLKAGMELRDLSPSFDRIALQDTVIPAIQPSEHNLSPWSLLKKLDAGLPKDFPVYLFSTDQLSDYSGERPVVRVNLNWHSIDAKNKPTEELAYSFTTSEEKIKTIRWVTTAAGNYYAEDSAGASANPDTLPVRITIYAGKNNTDAYYLNAAIKAISQYTGRNIVVSMQPATQLQQLIFWLPDTAPGEDILSSLTPTGTLFQYDQGSVVSIPEPFNNGLFALAENNRQHLYKYTSGHSSGTPMWSLSDGRPLLTTEEKNGRKIIHFKSRFHPQWTDLVWQEDFVRALLRIILPVPAEAADLRKIDHLQVMPRKATEALHNKADDSLFERRTDLSLPIWVAILIVFIIERFLSHHPFKQPKDA